MDGRISYWLSSIALALGCAGCVNPLSQKQLVADNPGQSAQHAPVPVPANAVVTKPRADDGPKRQARPATEISFGRLKEGEADSEAAKKNPEAQARLRDEARQAYQSAIKTDPNCLEAYRHLGRLYTKSGDSARALEIYQKLLVKNSKDASLWYDIGLCHHRRKDFKESATCFQKALEMDPENRDYLKKYGLTLAWLGQTDQAVVYLTRAQGAALAHCNVAGLLIGRGQRDLALQHVRQAERVNPDLPQVRELLADLDQPAANPNPRVAAK